MHTADSAMRGKGRFHVVHGKSATAVAPCPDVDTAQADADARNARARELGVDPCYVVEPVEDCTFVVAPKK